MKPWRELFFEEVEPPHHFHIGMRIIKTVIAVFICGLLGWLRDETSFFSMIAAVLCMQKSAEKTFTTSFNRIMGTALGIVVALVVNLAMPGPKKPAPVSALEDMDGPGPVEPAPKA